LYRPANMFLVTVRECGPANQRNRQKQCREPKFHNNLPSGSALS
jgi:hypothetical protein